LSASHTDLLCELAKRGDKAQLYRGEVIAILHSTTETLYCQINSSCKQTKTETYLKQYVAEGEFHASKNVQFISNKKLSAIRYH